MLFLKTFDPIQVKYAGYEWRKVVESVARAAEAVSKVRIETPDVDSMNLIRRSHF